ncbi:hypothetical protein ACNPQM_17075 [Streptomyces sp. NPDC056231]|uniref:hypothetical protein n=1 Tax=Streptomyces sp. NPDC056231 TaxID=3345755 RepID=UPI003AAB16E0
MPGPGTERPLWRHTLYPQSAPTPSSACALDTMRQEQLRPLLDDLSPAAIRAVTQTLLPDASRIPHKWLLVRTEADRPRVAAERRLRAHLRATVRRRRPTG